MNDITTIGIDVSKKYLDIHIFPKKKKLRIDNNPYSIHNFCCNAKNLDNLKQIALEASGGYERLLVNALISHKLPFTIINPKKARDFAKSAGLLAKTDKIDAYALALFAHKFDLRQSFIKSSNQIRLRELLQRRIQLLDMCSEEACHLEKCLNHDIQANIRKVKDFIDNEIKNIQKQIDTLIKEDEYFKKIYDLLIQITGIGKHTIETLLANLPELGQIGNKQVASLCGLAPFARESGSLRGMRHIMGGRAPIRRVLYLAVTSKIHYDKETKKYFKSMKDIGKPSKVIMVALMRKLVVTLNAKVRDLLAINQNFLLDSLHG